MALFMFALARPRRFERPTPTLGGWCSIQLSYERSNGRNGGIRTLDLLVPNQAHYQAVLRPDVTAINYYNDFQSKLNSKMEI